MALHKDPRFKYRVVHFVYVSIATLYCASIGNCVTAEEENVVYSCCSHQNTFDGESCMQLQQCASEFELDGMFRQSWYVPQKFRQNQSQHQLRIETRNVSNGHCKSSFRIRYPAEVSVTGNNDTFEIANNELFPAFLSNGSMIYENKSYYPTEYCFDRLAGEGERTVFNIEVTKGGCFKQVYQLSHRQPYREKWINQLFAAVSGLSLLFSLLNVIIYLSLRKYLNVSGWVEFVYFLALGVFSAFSIPAFLIESTPHNHTFCYISSVVLQFTSIMTYSTYIMIAFDVYWMLRKSENFASYGEEIEESKIRLVVYYFFLLAAPIGVTTYGVVLNLESTPAEYRMPALMANYGEKSCFAPAWLVSDYLLFGLESTTLIIILLSVNHIFGRLSASTDLEDAPRISLLSNLFFFTLSYWIMDLLKFARPLLLDKRSVEQTKSATFWIILDGFTYAQGIISFVVFIFNRKTLKAFRKKSGTDATLRGIFRHACCSGGSRIDIGEDATPMSPLMKSTSMQRSTVRPNYLY